MHEVYVDADACPVKDEVLKVAARHNWPIHMVSNSWMRLPETPLIHRIVVPKDPDAADDWIAERAGVGDLVITNNPQFFLLGFCILHTTSSAEEEGMRHEEQKRITKSWKVSVDQASRPSGLPELLGTRKSVASENTRSSSA